MAEVRQSAMLSIGLMRSADRLHTMLRRIALTATLFLLSWLVYCAFLLRPSNQRDWEFGMGTLPRITIRGGTVLVQDVRNLRYSARGLGSADYLDRVFELDRIERVWLVKEPFTIAPLTGFAGVAHTYFVFDFRDQPPLAISVEARREKGEAYDAARGLFNQYELIYIWGMEQAETGRRAVLEQNRLYMYPLTIPIEGARELFLQLARATQELETRPRFYNTLTSNCTNELAKAANKVKPGALPPNPALVFPGYSDDVLHQLGFVPNDISLEELNRRYYISDVVRADHEKDDFSKLLRLELQRREESRSDFTSARPAGRYLPGGPVGQ